MRVGQTRFEKQGDVLQVGEIVGLSRAIFFKQGLQSVLVFAAAEAASTSVRHELEKLAHLEENDEIFFPHTLARWPASPNTGQGLEWDAVLRTPARFERHFETGNRLSDELSLAHLGALIGSAQGVEVRPGWDYELDNDECARILWRFVAAIRAAHLSLDGVCALDENALPFALFLGSRSNCPCLNPSKSPEKTGCS